MTQLHEAHSSSGTSSSSRTDMVEGVRSYFQSRGLLRRGICLLNAGCLDDAEQSFREALKLNPDSADLGLYLAQALIAQGRRTEAAEELGSLADADRGDVASRIRQALLLWKDGKAEDAVGVLRAAVDADPDCAELHFQLGTLLASIGEDEEAELRFVTAVSQDGRHADASVSLAMCHAANGWSDQAVACLERAQRVRPHDSRICLLLSQARRACGAKPAALRTAARMPENHDATDTAAVSALGELLEKDADLFEVFTKSESSEVDEELFRLLQTTLSVALDRHPDSATLHYHQAEILDRLGENDPAIDSLERALALDPDSTRSMIRLAQLYRDNGRLADAKTRFEQVLRRGAHYADVYLQLGHLYRDEGRIDRARDAYRRALNINGRYQAAGEALDALPA